ncbi:conjugal transfer protein [Actinomadura sp. NEAU-AAG7]|uniref:conjugal transfer protein n=1 Tax=Actinomadura sp. NEAU-AAG7 TaxID=2839640 RepID=UPI001BE48E47|nr:conjugal transfer protein [Actinomadura sp. NEAU-AAG7]MBT2213957.1 hypothetical protein [Actinomadura sp. NEAU-AAG7]
MDLFTYTNIWRIEKRLYKLYDLRLPMPLPLVQIGVFAGVFVPWIVLLRFVGIPFESPWHVLYIVPPAVLTWLATRPVIEGKRLTELLLSQSRYFSEPRTWCRLTPIREPREVVIVARVWRRPGVAAPAPEQAAVKARRRKRKAAPEPEVAAVPAAPAVPRPSAASAPQPLAEYAAQRADAPAPPPAPFAPAPAAPATPPIPAEGVPVAEQPAADVPVAGAATPRPPKPWRRATRDISHEDDVLVGSPGLEGPPATPHLEAPGSGKRALASGVRRPGEPTELWQATPPAHPQDTPPSASASTPRPAAPRPPVPTDAQAAPREFGPPRGPAPQEPRPSEPAPRGAEPREPAAQAAPREPASRERWSTDSAPREPEPPASAPREPEAAEPAAQATPREPAARESAPHERSSTDSVPRGSEAPALPEPEAGKPAAQATPRDPALRESGSPQPSPRGSAPQEPRPSEPAPHGAEPREPAAQAAPREPASRERWSTDSAPREPEPPASAPREPEAGKPAAQATPHGPAIREPASPEVAPRQFGSPQSGRRESGPREVGAPGAAPRGPWSTEPAPRESEAAKPASREPEVREPAPQATPHEPVSRESAPHEARRESAPREPWSTEPAPRESEPRESAAEAAPRQPASPEVGPREAAPRQFGSPQSGRREQGVGGPAPREPWSTESAPREAAEKSGPEGRRDGTPVPQAGAGVEGPPPPLAGPRAAGRGQAETDTRPDVPQQPPVPPREGQGKGGAPQQGAGPAPRPWAARSSQGEPGDKKVAGWKNTPPSAPAPEQRPQPQRGPGEPPITRPDVPMVPGAFGARPPGEQPRKEPPKPWSKGLSKPARPTEPRPPAPPQPQQPQVPPAPAAQAPAPPQQAPHGPVPYPHGGPGQPSPDEQAPPREVRSGPASPVRPRPLPPPPAPPPSGPAITPPDPEHEVTAGGLRRLIQAVGGGHGDVDGDYQMRLQQPFQGTRHIVVLGCTGGAGQTVTALMLGHTFAQHNGEPIVAIDVNPGPGALARRTRSETNETLTGLITRADQVGSLTAMRRYTSQAKSGLDVVAAGKNPLQALDDRDYALAIRTIDKFYSVTLLDAAAAVVARVLPYADQVVLVAPASADAPRAVAMTFEWLDGHGYEELRSRAVTVINGVSRRSMDDVEQAEAVARGRCRALVRIPWDDHLSMDRAPRNELKSLRAPTRRAYLALAGVVAGGFTVVPERYQELQQEQEATR